MFGGFSGPDHEPCIRRTLWLSAFIECVGQYAISECGSSFHGARTCTMRVSLPFRYQYQPAFLGVLRVHAEPCGRGNGIRRCRRLASLEVLLRLMPCLTFFVRRSRAGQSRKDRR